MIKAIIFDCFGVVISDDLETAYKHFGGDFEKDRSEIVAILHESSSGRIESSAPVIAAKLGISEDEWRAENEGKKVINHELLKFVEELGEKYKTAMLSNIGKAGVGKFFEPGFLEKYFDPIVESATIGYAKPEASAYEITADKLGVRLDECVFIDDRQEYVDGAAAVGMTGFLYRSLDQLKADLRAITA